MIDEHFDRNYQAGRAELNAGIDRLFARAARGVAGAFKALNRIEYDAPWTARSKRRAKRT